MKTYEINIRETSYGFIRINAESRKEAEELVEEEWHAGNAIMCGDFEIEVIPE